MIYKSKEKPRKNKQDKIQQHNKVTHIQNTASPLVCTSTMGWLGDGSHRGEGHQTWTVVGLLPRYHHEIGINCIMHVNYWRETRWLDIPYILSSPAELVPVSVMCSSFLYFRDYNIINILVACYVSIIGLIEISAAIISGELLDFCLLLQHCLS